MNEDPIEIPLVWEDPESDYMLIGFGEIEATERSPAKTIGFSLMRENKLSLTNNYIPQGNRMQARRSDVKAALEHNRHQVASMLRRAKQIAKLYDSYEICLEDSFPSHTFIAVSENGVADVNNWNDIE
jgi:hypothetical protein